MIEANFSALFKRMSIVGIFQLQLKVNNIITDKLSDFSCWKQYEKKKLKYGYIGLFVQVKFCFARKATVKECFRKHMNRMT